MLGLIWALESVAEGIGSSIIVLIICMCKDCLYSYDSIYCQKPRLAAPTRLGCAK